MSPSQVIIEAVGSGGARVTAAVKVQAPVLPLASVASSRRLSVVPARSQETAAGLTVTGLKVQASVTLSRKSFGSRVVGWIPAGSTTMARARQTSRGAMVSRTETVKRQLSRFPATSSSK